MGASNGRDRRSIRREFHRLTGRLGTPAVERRWRGSPRGGYDVRLTTHGDRACASAVVALLATVVLGVAGIVSGQVDVASLAALTGFPLAGALGSHESRTHATVSSDGLVVVGNGIHRRQCSVPALAIATVILPEPRRSRWRMSRVAAVVVLHGGGTIPARALGYDPLLRGDRERAVARTCAFAEAARAAGAVVELPARRASA